MIMHRSRGFTLIETLVYLAIFSVLISSVVMAAYLLLQSGGKVQTQAMVIQEEQFVMATIMRHVGDANSISVPAAGTIGTALTLRSFGGTIHTISLSDSDILLNGVALNNTSVRMKNLSFQRSASAPESITVKFITSANVPNGQTVSFSASATKYLRK